MPDRELLHLGLSPRVVALDRATGELVWETKLPASGVVATVLVSGDRVFAGSAGEVVCLDARTGDLVWHNRLPGFGTHPVLFASEGGPSAAQAAADAAASAAVIAAVAASTSATAAGS